MKSLKELSDCEQIEAKIEAINRKFTEDMRQIDESHNRFMRRLNWWDGLAQGAIWGVSGTFVIVFVIALVAKHK